MERCAYQESGCRWSLVPEEMHDHLKLCHYRPLRCRECNVEFPYEKFLDHLKTDEKLIAHEVLECIAGFKIGKELLEVKPEEEQEKGNQRHPAWRPIWMRAFNRDFFCFLETYQNYWWIWMGGFGTPEEYQEFTSSITVWSVGTAMEKQFVGSVASIRSSPLEVLKSGRCLGILSSQMKGLFNGGKGIDVHIKISKEYQPPVTQRGILVKSPIEGAVVLQKTANDNDDIDSDWDFDSDSDVDAELDGE